MATARPAKCDDQGPGTAAGLPAIEELTRRGVNVNVTLLFSVERYGQVIDAYLRGLARRADAGEPVDTIVSAASFFLSRIDTEADERLEAGSPARGQIALASARLAYQRYRAKFTGLGWDIFVFLAPGRSGRCGRAPEPRTPATPTCATSRS